MRKGHKLREIVIRHRNSGYSVAISPYKEDSERATFSTLDILK
jgi:hypothetical protein